MKYKLNINPSHSLSLFAVILEKPIRIPRALSVKAASVLKGFLNKVRKTSPLRVDFKARLWPPALAWVSVPPWALALALALVPALNDQQQILLRNIHSFEHLHVVARLSIVLLLPFLK